MPTISGVTLKAGATAVLSAYCGSELVYSAGTNPAQYYFFGRRQYTPQATTNVSTSIYQVSRVYLGQTSADDDVHSIRIALPGHYNSTAGTYPTEFAAASTITIEGVSVGYGATQDPTAATWVAGTFGGNAGTTIDPTTNPVGVLSDDIISSASPIPSGSHVWAMVAYQAVSGSTLPLVAGFNPGSTEGGTSSTSTSQAAKLTNGASITVSANGGNFYAPSFVVCKGRTGKKVVLAWGDSLGNGQNENNFSSTLGVKGFIGRGLDAAGIMNHNACVSGSKPNFWIDNGRAGSVGHKLDLIKLVPNTPFTHILHEGGTNSGAGWNSEPAFINGIKAYIALLRAEFPGAHVTQMAMLPKVTSTDASTTTANQTPISGFGSGGFIDAFNRKLAADLLDGVADAYIDHTQPVRDGSDPHKFKVHPDSFVLAADYTSSATTINLTTAPTTKQYLVIGTAAVAVKSVSGTAGNYTVTLVNGSATALLSGATIKATYCPDGTHLSADAHVLCATAVPSWAESL